MALAVHVIVAIASWSWCGTHVFYCFFLESPGIAINFRQTNNVIFMKWRGDEFTYMTHDMTPNPGPEQDTVYVPGNPGPLIRTFYWWYLKFNSLMIMFLLRSWMDWWWNKSYKIQDSAGSLQLLITQNSLGRSTFTGYSPRQRCAGRNVQHWHCAEGRHWECSFEANVPWLCEIHRWVC